LAIELSLAYPQTWYSHISHRQKTRQQHNQVQFKMLDINKVKKFELHLIVLLPSFLSMGNMTIPSLRVSKGKFDRQKSKQTT
jgi:hypothetical protein